MFPLKWLRRSGIVAGSPNQETGRIGEELAEDYLRRRKGFRILVRNWRAGRDEIDLVAREGKVFVFVEVKTRRGDGLVPGYFAAVGKRKRAALCRAVKAYLRGLPEKPATFRFDVVEVNLKAAPKDRVLHFENIPLFPKNFRVR